MEIQKLVVEWCFFPWFGFHCAACGSASSFQLCANDILDGVDDLVDGISLLSEPDKTLHPQDSEPQHNSGHGDEEGEASDGLWNSKHELYLRWEDDASWHKKLTPQAKQKLVLFQRSMDSQFGRQKAMRVSQACPSKFFSSNTTMSF